ncbi:hypothetical protein [Candidatus Poriferisodalis sp.]|uniref:hypothetical protein n=1 Tax=Candidatus Poriferisodalis sp. TaxID=3101277 RepID=UPI003B02E975
MTSPLPIVVAGPKRRHCRAPATIDEVTLSDAPSETEAAQVLTEFWQATDGDRRGNGDAAVAAGSTRVCRNARYFSFDGFAQEDEDLATSWRKLLEREGKRSPESTSVRDLVLGPTSASTPQRTGPSLRSGD